MEKIFRLKNIVEKALHTLSPNGLADAINAANQAAKTGASITRYVLLRLVNNTKNVSLSYSNLVALDCYFSQQGQGLDENPIFERRGLLNCLVEKKRVTFLFAGKPSITEKHDDVSLWDTRSIAKIIQDLYQCQSGIEVELLDVLLANNSSELPGMAWYERLEQTDRSIICIGSPRACLASEVMLSKMCQVDPFVRPKPAIGNIESLPFYFLWPSRLRLNIDSHFVPKLADVRQVDPKLAEEVRRNKSAAICLDGKWTSIPMQGKHWNMYGIIAAQRRSGGQIWMVIAGISGPATYAASHLIENFDDALPQAGDDSPIMWAPMTVPVHVDSQKKGGDNRVPGKARLIGKPRLWPKHNGLKD